MKDKPIIIAGCGPGSEEYLTPAALHAMKNARLLVGAPRLLECARPDHPARRVPVRARIATALDEIDKELAGGGIVVLVSGDPGVCSLAGPVLRRFGHARCEILPGISSMQTAFARLGLEWFGARLLSAHNTAPSCDPASLAREDCIGLLVGNPANRAWVESLVHTLIPTHDIHVCENLTLPDESVRPLTTPNELMNLKSLAILVFSRKEARA